MATYSKLPSGRWRVQVRRGDIYRAHTFDLKRQAKTWATEIEAQALQVQAGGVTIAQDLSYLATALDWGRHTKRFDVDPEVARDARRSLKHRKLDTRSQSRERLPTQDELDALYKLWDENPRQLIPMTILVQFALVSAMRLGEICGIRIEDIDTDNKTVLVRQRKEVRKWDKERSVTTGRKGGEADREDIAKLHQEWRDTAVNKRRKTWGSFGCKLTVADDLQTNTQSRVIVFQYFRPTTGLE